jgi:hypothetical protein
MSVDAAFAELMVIARVAVCVEPAIGVAFLQRAALPPTGQTLVLVAVMTTLANSVAAWIFVPDTAEKELMRAQLRRPSSNLRFRKASSRG